MRALRGVRDRRKAYSIDFEICRRKQSKDKRLPENVEKTEYKSDEGSGGNHRKERRNKKLVNNLVRKFGEEKAK